MSDSATPWTVAYQAPPPIGFSRQEYWSGLPFPSPGDLPDPGIEPGSPAFQADALISEPPGKPLYRVSILLKRIFFKRVTLKKKSSLDFRPAKRAILCAHLGVSFRGRSRAAVLK